MSTTSCKRPHAQALEDAEAFKALFPPAFYERWTFAGSLRRRKPEVSDVEHVVIPAWGDVERGDGLFTVSERVNLLFFHLDALVRGGQVSKHIYGATGYRWGDKHRGCSFRGFAHEIFTADESNFGSAIAIRTGPAEFSKRLVIGLRNHGRRNKDGLVWQCRLCPTAFQADVKCDEKCPLCQGTNLEPMSAVAAPDERRYFELCGIPWAEPEARQ